MRLPPATYMIVVLGIQSWAECDAQPSGLTIAIFDSEGVKPSVLERSKREATRILGDTEYGLTWVHCLTDGERAPEGLCRQPAGPAFLVLRVLPENNHTDEKGALGSAILPAGGFGSYFVVFYGRVKQIAKLESSEGVLLGHAIAHELGHLLLGSNAHTRDGIMAGYWSARELARIAKGSLTFSEEQRVRMRNNVSGRLLAAERDFPIRHQRPYVSTATASQVTTVLAGSVGSPIENRDPPGHNTESHRGKPLPLDEAR